MKIPQSKNNGGSLNDFLAVERTVMANERTLLSFIRTALYFSVAALTLTQFVSIDYAFIFQAIFFVLAALILAVGLYKYRRQRQRIQMSREHIENYNL